MRGDKSTNNSADKEVQRVPGNPVRTWLHKAPSTPAYSNPRCWPCRRRGGCPPRGYVIARRIDRYPERVGGRRLGGGIFFAKYLNAVGKFLSIDEVDRVRKKGENLNGDLFFVFEPLRAFIIYIMPFFFFSLSLASFYLNGL